MNLNILIVGVGGQGTLLASRILGDFAQINNFDCKLSEVHGMAQRGGSVVTYVKMGDKINSPIIYPETCDVVLSFEKLEALRYSHFIKNGGTIIYNDYKIMPLPVVTGAMEYPNDIELRLTKITKNVVRLNADELSKKVGSNKVLNVIMLGKLCKTLNLDKLSFENAIKNTVPKQHLDVNLKAFETGYNA